MNNPAYHRQEEDRPKTDTVPKQVKKSFIAWLVPTLSLGVLMCVFLVVQNWADGRYTTRKNMEDQAAAINKALADEQMARVRALSEEQSRTEKTFADEKAKREALQETVGKMDRKLDLIIYIIQRDGKMDPNTAKSMLPNP